MKILVGDCRKTLKNLPDQSVHCCVTSPPYYGLRDYGVDGQIGLEETPEEYVTKMVAVFAEVKRVLRDDGTLWLNIGDSYAGTKVGNTNGTGAGGASTGKVQQKVGVLDQKFVKRLAPGCKSKDLIGIPWMLAFALRADGWYLRSDVIWHKPNAMCESVEDRPAKSHEYLFLLTKSQRYYYDHIAVRRSPQTYTRKGGSAPYTGESGHTNGIGSSTLHQMAPTGSNLRTVWTIPTAAFGGGHFATFPEKLVKPCILAGTSAKGCCPKCGAPWKRIVEKQRKEGRERVTCGDMNAEGVTRVTAGLSVPAEYKEVKVRTIGWEPTCKHKSLDPVPCTVLDPFGGAGTTGLTADRLGRNFVLCELNPEYAKMAKGRIKRKGVPRAAKKKPAPGGFDV